jgi:hypothetical protein
VAAIKSSLPRFFVFKRAFPFSAPGTVEITTGSINANAEHKAVVKPKGRRVTQLGLHCC